MPKDKNIFRNILVVIDPAKETQFALKRALKMNKILADGIKIHLFISYEMDELRKSQDTFEFHCDNDWFADLVKPLAAEGIDYNAEVFWTADWHQSILGSVRRNDIDMIVMSDHMTEENGNDLSAAKWSLLRISDCPVLIVHPGAQVQRKTVLAAVNMQTSNPRYVELNRKILAMSRQISVAYGAEKHIVNAYEDSMEFPDRAKLLRDTQTKQQNTHVQQGDPVSIIADVANDIEADIVVIGTLSRRGIMAAMRGNKSEEIIRKLNRDVMILN